MASCDYCEAEFDDEPAYLDHLAAAHDDELSRIDRRRVEARSDDEEGRSLLSYAIVAVAVALIVGLGAFAFQEFAGPPTDEFGLPTEGSHPALSDVERFDSNGRTHVAGEVDYPRTPPTSGPHADSAATAGFYEETLRTENLVHSLEHGAVVIYYDPAALSDESEADLREFASEFDTGFASVIVAPHPAEDPPAAYTLTAWQHRLRLSEYDREAVRAFLAEYLGRGPERPVR